MSYYIKADGRYMNQLHDDLLGKHQRAFEGCDKGIDSCVKSLRWWYMHLPKGIHPADLNPKTAARYFICSRSIHEVVKYLHYTDHYDEAIERYDLDEIVNTAFLLNVTKG